MLKVKVKFSKLLKRIAISVLLITLFGLNISQAQKQANQPKVVAPGLKKSAPSDAIVLFKKGSLENFVSVKDNDPAPWKVKGKQFTVLPESGNILSKEKFGDIQLHIEWRIPKDAALFEGQKSGNSGIYLMGKYEVQVLNSFQNETYIDGQAGAVYRQHPPMVNASLQPGKWQIYDIVFEAPKFNANRNQIQSPFVTVFHNGILVQNHAEIKGPTTAFNEDLPESANEGPLMLQDHNNKVSFRNIWIRKL